MGKDFTVLGKFYLKSGVVIEDKVVFDKENTEEEIKEYMDSLKEGIKMGFKENMEFQFTFGFTTIRGSELAAFTMTVAESEEEAIQKAYEEFGGIYDYCWNGRTDTLIGVDGSTEWIEADGIVEFNSAEED